MRIIVLVMALLAYLPLSASAQGLSAGVAAAIEDLVDANRILAAQGILPGYGHVSVRHPEDPTRYFLSRSLAPELVTADDIVEFDLEVDWQREPLAIVTRLERLPDDTRLVFAAAQPAGS